MSLSKEAIRQQMSAIAFEAWLGAKNRQLAQSERLDNGCRIIDSVIAALIRTPGFLQSETYGNLLGLGNTSTFSINVRRDCLYEIDFMPTWEGQQLGLKKGNRSIRVDTTLVTDGNPDALIKYTGEDKNLPPDSTDTLRESVSLVREFEEDLVGWVVPEFSQAA